MHTVRNVSIGGRWNIILDGVCGGGGVGVCGDSPLFIISAVHLEKKYFNV